MTKRFKQFNDEELIMLHQALYPVFDDASEGSAREDLSMPPDSGMPRW